MKRRDHVIFKVFREIKRSVSTSSSEIEPLGFSVKLEWNETIADAAVDPLEALWGPAFQGLCKLIQNEP